MKRCADVPSVQIDPVLISISPNILLTVFVFVQRNERVGSDRLSPLPGAICSCRFAAAFVGKFSRPRIMSPLRWIPLALVVAFGCVAAFLAVHPALIALDASEPNLCAMTFMWPTFLPIEMTSRSRWAHKYQLLFYKDSFTQAANTQVRFFPVSGRTRLRCATLQNILCVNFDSRKHHFYGHFAHRSRDLIRGNNVLDFSVVHFLRALTLAFVVPCC